MSGPAVAHVVSPASAAVATTNAPAPQQNGLFTRMGKGLKGMLGMAGGRRRRSSRKATRKGRKATRKGRKATRRRRVSRGGGGVCRSC
jgi:hypothetical protein